MKQKLIYHSNNVIRMLAYWFILNPAMLIFIVFGYFVGGEFKEDMQKIKKKH